MKRSDLAFINAIVYTNVLNPQMGFNILPLDKEPEPQSDKSRNTYLLEAEKKDI